uniref:Reverse transcriptase Ty1/copia-type domain-containing protein n=1 Tax=Amphimedon queenslandica TaxID=400682 RepID=A0A1X7TV83_AMPQE
MHQCKSLTTPMDTGTKLVNGTEDSEYVDNQSLVGSLMYLSMRTQPDITYAVSITARFCSNPTTQHMTAVKHVLRYLRGTTHYGDRNDCKSTSGFLFQLGGTAFTCQSKKQTCVALSTAEAKYIALAGAAQDAVWLKHLYQEIADTLDKPDLINDNNQAAIAMSRKPQYHGRVKHSDIKYHFIREQIHNLNIKLEY